MLEHLPRGVGEALRGVRPGEESILFHHDALAGAPDCIEVTSPAFSEGQPIPARFTADGEKLSPPLAWRGVPEGAHGVVLAIEDPDAPAAAPFVHALAWALPGYDAEIGEGALKGAGSPGEPISLGRNAFFAAEYLPPDPPPGHGPHRYCVQVFALDATPDLHGAPIRSQVVHAIKGHVIGRGLLVGTYERP